MRRVKIGRHARRDAARGAQRHRKVLLLHALPGAACAVNRFSRGARSIGRRQSLFSTTGCALCHTPALTTGNSTVAALRNKAVNLFSDLLVHDMGPGSADGVSQGQAGPREFRSAPLWGLGQRIFFLRDGRTFDLVEAIQAHKSGSSFSGDASEANEVVKNFNDLLESQKQDLLNFLRSL